MSRKVKIGLAKYGGCAAFVATLAWLYISLRPFAELPLVDQYCVLCDALTVPGVVLIMVGLLIAISNTGALDGLFYALSFAIRSLIPGGRGKRDERYADYVDRRRENKLKGYGFLIIAGGITVAAALVFLALFYSVYQ